MKKAQTIYLAQMKWCEYNEPICAGTNKKKISIDALRRLKAEHGTGPVCRGQAMCQVKITSDDIEIVKIPFLDFSKLLPGGGGSRGGLKILKI